MNQRLRLLKKSSKISEETYKLLRSSDGIAPRLYGLPKIHKEGVPLRPIVSFVNFPIQLIMFRATWLEFYLLLLVTQLNITVKNSQHFAKFIRGQTLDTDQMLVSLFTKIPVDLAIKVATNRLRYDDSL